MGSPDEPARPTRIEELFKFSHGHRVRYDEVDAQGIVGNASWLNLLQLGRIEYLRYLSLMLEGGTRSPVQAVVRKSVIDYLVPARFDDALAIRVRTGYLGQRSARFVERDEAHPGPLEPRQQLVEHERVERADVEQENVRDRAAEDAPRERVVEGEEGRGGLQERGFQLVELLA